MALLTFNIDNSFENDPELCSILTEMFKRDKAIRKECAKLIHPFYRIKDSLIKADKLSREDYLKLKRSEQITYVNKAKKMAAKRLKHKSPHHDSLRRMLLEVDRNNTQSLIAIIKKRGWINKGDLSCLNESVWPALIFRHAPKEFWGEIRPLIEKEYREKRMAKRDYDLIDQHLKGRPSYRLR